MNVNHKRTRMVKDGEDLRRIANDELQKFSLDNLFKMRAVTKLLKAKPKHMQAKWCTLVVCLDFLNNSFCVLISWFVFFCRWKRKAKPLNALCLLGLTRLMK